MASKIFSRDIWISVMSPLVMNGPNLRNYEWEREGEGGRGREVEGEWEREVYTKESNKGDIYLKNLNLKITHVKAIQVNWSAHCAADSIILPYIPFASFQSRGG